MREQVNDFLKICDNLERDYRKEDGNKFRYTKNYLEKNVGYDYDQLKSIHAEATDEKAGDTYATMTNMFTLVISLITVILTMVNILAPSSSEGKVDQSAAFLCLVYTIVITVFTIMLDLGVGKNKSMSHWQKYIVEAVEDILDDMKNEKDNRKEVHLPDNLYEKLDNLETKVDLPDRLYDQLGSIEKVASESPLKKIISKK